MKKIGILSDTHSCWDDRFATHFKNCVEIWHAGDVGDISVIARLEEVCPVVRAVSGNIDSGQVRRRCKELEVFTVDGVKVMMMHISGYPGRYAPGTRRLIIEHRPLIMVGGHSHILKVMWDKELNCLHINPGAAGHHGWQRERTLLRLTVDNATIKDLEVIELGKFKV